MSIGTLFVGAKDDDADGANMVPQHDLDEPPRPVLLLDVALASGLDSGGEGGAPEEGAVRRAVGGAARTGQRTRPNLISDGVWTRCRMDEARTFNTGSQQHITRKRTASCGIGQYLRSVRFSGIGAIYLLTASRRDVCDAGYLLHLEIKRLPESAGWLGSGGC